MPAEDRPTGYCIGDLSLDLVHRRIRRDGEILPCGKLTFDLLVLLAEQAPGVVGREALVERLWDGRYVSPATIKQRVALLRQALGDQADKPRYIRVSRGQGYALIPGVRASYAQAMLPGRARYFGLAAGGLVAAFVLGAEIGYQDGLRPGIPDLQGAASIIVTSRPHQLPPEEYAFVMGTAERVLSVISNPDFVGRLNRMRAGSGALAQDSLTVVANATSDDLESIGVTLTVLNDGRPDMRLSRTDELQSWLRALQESSLLTSTGYKVQVLPPDPADNSNFALVAHFGFDRAEIRADPQTIQAHAAQSVAMAIDEQAPRL